MSSTAFGGSCTAGRGITRNLSEESSQANWDSETALLREQQARQVVYATSSLADAGTQFRAAVGRPSEMRGAVTWALADIGQKIDAALPKAKLDAQQMAQVKKLRAEGEQLHKAGKHGESMAALGKAKGILGIK